MEIGSCVKCAETFSACGCGSKAAENLAVADVDIHDGMNIPAGSGAIIGQAIPETDFTPFGASAENAPVPADPRVSPLNTGLYSPSDTPEMAAEDMNNETNIQFDTDAYEDMTWETPSDELEDAVENLLVEVKRLRKAIAEDMDGRVVNVVGGGDKVYVTLRFPDSDKIFVGDMEDVMLAETDREILEQELFDLWGTGQYDHLKDEQGFYFISPAWSEAKEPFTKWAIANLPQFAPLGETFEAESKFDKLAKEIAEEYEEKGKSPKEAMEIGEATAANIGRAKFGKRKFAKMGKKAEDDIDFDKSKADRNKDGRISDWERAVGNKVAKGIRESKRAEVGPHVPTRIAATTTPRGVVKTYTSIPAGDGHVVGQFTPDMDYAPSGMYGAESLTSSIEKGFGAVLGIMSGLIVGGFAMGAVSSLSKDDENRE